jgi:hypothetical protein
VGRNTKSENFNNIKINYNSNTKVDLSDSTAFKRLFQIFMTEGPARILDACFSSYTSMYQERLQETTNNRFWK